MKTILVLDDDETIVSTFSVALRHCGYRVIEAFSGEEGLELARKHLPDLILSDINMPGKDGRAVLQGIREHPELSTTQVVLMTGQTHIVTMRNGMELGADDFLIKPVSLGDLLRCIDARLKRAQIHWRVEDRLLTKLRSTLHSALPHELFTPLGGIIGLAEILKTDDGSLASAESKELLEDIHSSALRLHRTLRNYLMILSLESHDSATAPTARKLVSREVKESLATGFQAAVHRHRREDDVEISIEACEINGSIGDLTLIAEELLDNACKFSRPNSKIAIQFREAVLTVTDEGRGMTREEIARVGTFQQFDRKKQEQQGLGLGLALVQKLMDRCGGTLAIQSEPGQGTTITVTFQAA